MKDSGELVRRSSYYTNAAVCRRGHVETSSIDGGAAAKCGRCGASILTGCAACGQRIRGMLITPGVVNLAAKYNRPDFCDSCGTPHPWASRQARLYELENLLEDEEISDADRLIIHEQLEALRDPDLDEEEQLVRWRRVNAAAGVFRDPALRILETLTTAAIKAQIGA